MHFPTAWLVVGALAAGPIDGALPDFEVPAFTYILPSGFHGWVCVDFGVAGAKALKRAKDGSFVVEASAGRVLATSSFPHKIMPPVPQTVLQKEGSALGPADDDLLLPRRTVGRASSDNPVSRYCLFFGTEAEAGRAKSPPGLDSALEGASGPDTTPAGARGSPGESVMPKAFRLRADQIETLATNRGGCVASDRITVDGQLVGYMYRAAPHNDLDSGWRFLAGDESNEYMRDSSRHGVYDINTIANYDPAIIPFLDAPEGAAFERDETSLEFKRIAE